MPGAGNSRILYHLQHFYTSILTPKVNGNVWGKRKTLPDLEAVFMVDTKGLEPMTFRTSSGCSTS